MKDVHGPRRMESHSTDGRVPHAGASTSLRTLGPMALLTLATLVIGVAVIDDFGISWDEEGDASYGRTALQAYQDPGYDWNAYGNRKFYGPVHFIFQQAVVDLANDLGPPWDSAQSRHFANFLAFEVSIVAFYVLAGHFVSMRAALSTTVLFATQPLYLGHAFINGKDTPFMAAFLVVLALGFKSLDHWPRPSRHLTPEGLTGSDDLAHAARQAWKGARRSLRGFAFILTGMALLVFLDLWFTRTIFYSPLDAAVRAAYDHQGPSWLDELFDRVAQNAGNLTVDAYLSKATRVADRILSWAGVMLLGAGLLTLGWIFRTARRALAHQIKDVSVADWVRSGAFFWLVATGIAAGLLNSIRPVGFLALLLVGIISLWRHGARAAIPFCFVGLVAALSCYLSWPFLWHNPLDRFIESVRFLVGNPNKDYVLYLGQVTKGRLLPWHFLPVLMLIQFTEPLWALALLGAAALGFGWVSSGRRRELGLLLPIWLLVPTVPLILGKAWFYDNFRQFLFVTPVWFLLAGHGWDVAFLKVRPSGLRWALVLAAVLPGILAAVRLHPYEYVYYNALAGGTRGAARHFELDYWGTAYSAAMRRLNETSPYGTSIAFLGTDAPARPYAREDLELSTYDFDQDPTTVPVQIWVATTRANADLDLQRFTRRIGEITIDSAVLAVIRSR